MKRETCKYNNVPLKDVLIPVAVNENCIVFGISHNTDSDTIDIMATGILHGNESLIRIDKVPDKTMAPIVSILDVNRKYNVPIPSNYTKAIIKCATEDYDLDIITHKE